MALPPLIVFGSEPFPSFYNQVVALLLWGLLVYSHGQRDHSAGRSLTESSRELLTAVGALALMAVVSSAWRTVPWGVTCCNIAVLAGAVPVVLMAGSLSGNPGDPSGDLRTTFVRAIALATVLNCAPAFVQVFVPHWIDGHWLSQAWSPDRISGNVRQPNLLATFCAWGVAAFVALKELKRCSRLAAWLLVGLLLATMAATGSRVGAAEVAALATWSVVDRRLSRDSRTILFLCPFFLLACWLGLRWWASFSGIEYGRAPMVASGRYALWRQCVSLIADHPWWGVGMGNFNIAWTLTPFDRSGNPETFDHAHNLLLHWAVELGIPVTLAVVGLLSLSLWHCVQRERRTTGAESIIRRFCLMMIALVLIHSLTEYPLWYDYLLYPTVFAWGVAATSPRGSRGAVASTEDGGSSGAAYSPQPSGWLSTCGLLMALAAALATFDYQKIVTIYHPWDGAPPVDQRVADGRKAVIYGYVADRFAGTLAKPGHRSLEPYKTATRRLLDMRLLIAWSLALDEAGKRDKARYLAQRVKDFDDPVAKQFFAPCDAVGPGTTAPWQCSPPSGRYSFEDFLSGG